VSARISWFAVTLQEQLHPSLNQGLLKHIGLAGPCIGTGTFPSNISSPLGGLGTVSEVLWVSSDAKRGITTPHSQFRQFNFGFFVIVSFTSRPLSNGHISSVTTRHANRVGLQEMKKRSTHQALSDKLALPQYAQPAYTLPPAAATGSRNRANKNYF